MSDFIFVLNGPKKHLATCGTTKLICSICFIDTRALLARYGAIWRNDWRAWIISRWSWDRCPTMPDDISSIFRGSRQFHYGPRGESSWLCLRGNCFHQECAESHSTTMQHSEYASKDVSCLKQREKNIHFNPHKLSVIWLTALTVSLHEQVCFLEFKCKTNWNR